MEITVFHANLILNITVREYVEEYSFCIILINVLCFTRVSIVT